MQHAATHRRAVAIVYGTRPEAGRCAAAIDALLGVGADDAPDTAVA